MYREDNLAGTVVVKDRGLIADRPTHASNNIGDMYFATDKGSNGAPIYWTGTQWVDATGASVS